MSQTADQCLCIDQQHRIEPRPHLFADVREFCMAFFHAKRSFEWRMPDTLCLCANSELRCFRTVVYAYAVLERAGRPPYAVMYRNCYRGSSERNVHAEEFLMRDPRVRYCTVPATLTVVLSYQPCHNSSGTAKTAVASSKSCTARLLEFLDARPLLRLRLVCPAIYRASYTNAALFRTASDHEAVAERVQMARTGLKLLMRHERVTIEAPSGTLWRTLSASIARNGVVNISPQQWRMRRQFDQCIATFLAELRQEVAAERAAQAADADH